MYSDIQSIDDAIEMGAFDDLPPEREPPPSVDDIPIDNEPDWIDVEDVRAGRQGAGKQKFEKEPSPGNGKLRFPCRWHWEIQPKPTNWLVQDWLEQEALGVIFGPVESFKSFVAIDMACAIASGAEWHGFKTFGAERPVLYVVGEGGSGFRRRIKAWCMYHGIEDKAVKVLEMPAFMADDSLQVQAAIESIREVLGDESPCALFIDTLNRAMSGDENDSHAMTQMVHGLDAIRKALSCAVVVIHHSGWGDRTRVRGSSVLHGAIDVSIRANRIEDTVSIEATKMKDADKPGMLYLLSRRLDLGEVHPDTGDSITSLVMVDAQKPEIKNRIPKSGDKLAIIQEVLCEMLEAKDERLDAAGKQPEGRVSYADWVAACRKLGVSRQVIHHNKDKFAIKDGYVYG